MVTRVIGKANDFELIFDCGDGDCWTATAPSNIYGAYSLELLAYDTAGNESYMATMIYIISKKTLKGYLIPFEYAGLLDNDELTARLDESGLEAVLMELAEMKGGTDG